MFQPILVPVHLLYYVLANPDLVELVVLFGDAESGEVEVPPWDVLAISG